MTGKDSLADLTPTQRQQAFSDYREKMMRTGNTPSAKAAQPQGVAATEQPAQDAPLPGVTADQDLIEGCVAAIVATRATAERKASETEPLNPKPESVTDPLDVVERSTKRRDMYPSRNADQPPGPGLLRWITRKLNLK